MSLKQTYDHIIHLLFPINSQWIVKRINPGPGRAASTRVSSASDITLPGRDVHVDSFLLHILLLLLLAGWSSLRNTSSHIRRTPRSCSFLDVSPAYPMGAGVLLTHGTFLSTVGNNGVKRRINIAALWQKTMQRHYSRNTMRISKRHMTVRVKTGSCVNLIQSLKPNLCILFFVFFFLQGTIKNVFNLFNLILLFLKPVNKASWICLCILTILRYIVFSHVVKKYKNNMNYYIK
jgi:hypothetical protein